jgi:WD40 repeat protein
LSSTTKGGKLWRLILPVTLLVVVLFVALLFILGPLPPEREPSFPDAQFVPVIAHTDRSPGQPRAGGLPRRALLAVGSGHLYHPAAQELTFSPDGTLLASQAPDGTVRTWDVATGWLRHAFALKPGRALAFTSDGARLWTVSESGLCVHDLAHDSDTAIGVADPAREAGIVSAELKYLVAKTADGNIQVWDLFRAREAGRVKSITAGAELLASAPETNQFIEIDPTGAHLCEGKSGLERGRLELEQHRITAAAFAATTPLLVTVCEGGELSLWEAGGNWIGRCPAPVGAAEKLMISANARTVATLGQGKIFVWNTEGPVFRSKEQTPRLAGAAVSPDGKLFAAISPGGHVHLWSVATGEEKFAGPNRRWPVEAAHLSPSGKALATASSVSGIRIWNVATGAEDVPGKAASAPYADISFERLSVYATPVSSGTTNITPTAPDSALFAFSPDGRVFASVQGGTVVLTELASGHRQALPLAAKVRVAALSFDADNQQLAVLATGGQLQIFSLAHPRSGRRLESTLQTAAPGSLAFSNKRHQLAYFSPGEDHAWIWDLERNHLDRVALPAGLRFAAGASFSDALQVLVVGPEPDTVWRVDLNGQSRSLKLSHRGARVTAVALSKSGLITAVAGATGAISVTDLSNGRTLSLEGHNTVAQHLEFSADGGRLVSQGTDGVATVWDLSTPAGVTKVTVK